MVLTKKQEEGLKLAVARYKAHEPWTYDELNLEEKEEVKLDEIN